MFFFGRIEEIHHSRKLARSEYGWYSVDIKSKRLTDIRKQMDNGVDININTSANCWSLVMILISIPLLDDVGGNIIAYLKTVTFGLLTRPRSVRYASYVQLTNLWAAIYELWALKAIPQTTTLWNG